MKASIFAVLVAVGAALALPHGGIQGKMPPKYGAYIVSGFIDLPYAEIHEQFTLFFDPVNNRSRVDYYNGLVKTIQVGGNAPSMVMVLYVSTETVMNQLTCYQMNGSVDIPVYVQPGIPDLTNFTYLGQTDFNGHTADQWQYIEHDGAKTATYTFTVDPVTAQPFRYEMMGYDTLFGSHFDKYVVEYTFYVAAQAGADNFMPPGNMTCQGFPPDDQHSAAEHAIQMNPMGEYIGHGVEQHHDTLFESFKHKHGKQYSSDEEHAQRKATFRQNVRFIHSTNRAGKSYKVAINHLADRTDAERKVLRGHRRGKSTLVGESFNPAKHNLVGLKDMPDTVDWRINGAVTPVKDQAICGSCWSFGTTGTIEGSLFLKTGNLMRLSQQELMDCSWGEGNYACEGGEETQAYQWILQHGLTSEEYYGPYLGNFGMCHSNNVSSVVNITGYVNVTQNNVTALKMALAMNGPISVDMDASVRSFSFYASGVYYDSQCQSGIDDLDHAVLAVGYGTLMGQDYWLVKNSWSTYWGNDGYFLISPNDNNCGIMTSPTFVNLK